MEIIYKEDSFDLSDDGSQAREVELEIELELASKKLSPRDQKIIKMVNEGYSQREIEKELKVSHHTIRATLDRLLDIIE